MALLKNWALAATHLLHSVKDANLQWQTANQAQQTKLRQQRILAEKSLVADLAKKSAQLQHELALLKAKNDTELALFKTRCQQDLKDYKQYLQALDRLKRSIQQSHPHLPEAVAFTIHHHAKQLLNKMWEADNFEQKMRDEMRLIQFMTTVHEDAQLCLEGGGSEKLPEKTLGLLQQQDGQ